MLGKVIETYNFTMISYKKDESNSLEKTQTERDLGLMISNNLKFSDQPNLMQTIN